MASLTSYEQKIVSAYRTLSEENEQAARIAGGHIVNVGASPAEVTTRLARDGDLSQLDTVIDIADLMKSLRARGHL